MARPPLGRLWHDSRTRLGASRGLPPPHPTPQQLPLRRQLLVLALLPLLLYPPRPRMAAHCSSTSPPCGPSTACSPPRWSATTPRSPPPPSSRLPWSWCTPWCTRPPLPAWGPPGTSPTPRAPAFLRASTPWGPTPVSTTFTCTRAGRRASTPPGPTPHPHLVVERARVVALQVDKVGRVEVVGTCPASALPPPPSLTSPPLRGWA